MDTASAPVGEPAATQPAPAPEAPAPTPAQEAPNPSSVSEAHPPTTPASDKNLSAEIDQIDDIDKLDAILEESERNSPPPISGRRNRKQGSPAAATEPVVQKTAPATPPPAAEVPPPTPTEDDAPVRLWMKSLSVEDRALATAAVNMVRESQRDGGNLTIRQAFAKLAGTEAPASPAPTPAAPSTPEPTGVAAFEAKLTEQATKISAKETEIESLEQKLAEAEEGYVSAAEKQAIRKDIRTAERALNTLERERDRLEDSRDRAAEEAEFEANEAFNTTYRSAVVEAAKILPGSTTRGHQDHTDVLATVAELERKNPKFFDDPEYPIYIASLIVARRAQSAAQRPPAEPEFPEPSRPTRDVPPVVGAEATTAQPFTRDAVLKRIDEMDSDELDQLADAIGSKAPESRKRR